MTANDFPRILTLLRKEKGISQKAASLELGISQALLSHYEKGLRECGLDFVVKVADYYQVSCDYLLGRSAERTGAILGEEDIPDPESGEKENRGQGNLLPVLNKKLIGNSLNVIYGMLARCGNKELTINASQYLSIAVYKLYRYMYTVNHKNPQNAFTLSGETWSRLCEAAMALNEMTVSCLTSGVHIDGADPVEDAGMMNISPERLYREYPLFAGSLLNLVRNTEDNILSKIGKK